MRQRRARLIGTEARHLIFQNATEIRDFALIPIALDLQFAQFTAHLHHLSQDVFDSHLELLMLFAASERRRGGYGEHGGK